MGQARPRFVYFLSFHNTKTNIAHNLTIIDQSIESELGTRTQGGMMECADESTETRR